MRLTGLILLLASFLVHAEDDIRGASDYPLLGRFAGSYIVQYSQQAERDYRFVLGGLEKINGVLAPEKEQRLSGQLTQITYRIPEYHNPEEAFRFIETQIEDQGGTRLFGCTGRDCGSSNQWANNIFRYSRLYGVDNTQSYAAYQLENRSIALYSVRRGNKRVYLRLEVLETAPSSTPESVSENNLPQQISGTEEELKGLLDYLTKHPETQLWLVGWDRTPGSYQEQKERGANQAQAIKDRLIVMGADELRIHIHSLGAFTVSGVSEPDKPVFVFSESR